MRWVSEECGLVRWVSLLIVCYSTCFPYVLYCDLLCCKEVVEGLSCVSSVNTQ